MYLYFQFDSKFQTKHAEILFSCKLNFLSIQEILNFSNFLTVKKTRNFLFYFQLNLIFLNFACVRERSGHRHLYRNRGRRRGGEIGGEWGGERDENEVDK